MKKLYSDVDLEVIDVEGADVITASSVDDSGNGDTSSDAGDMPW